MKDLPSPRYRVGQIVFCGKAKWRIRQIDPTYYEQGEHPLRGWLYYCSSCDPAGKLHLGLYEAEITDSVPLQEVQP